jgi:hypothetical protein
MLDRAFEHRARPAETVAGIEQAAHLRVVFRPLLDLVEVPSVGDQWIGGLLVEGDVIGQRLFGRHTARDALAHDLLLSRTNHSFKRHRMNT